MRMAPLAIKTKHHVVCVSCDRRRVFILDTDTTEIHDQPTPSTAAPTDSLLYFFIYS